MNSTIEQQTIISHVASAACTPLTLIDSIAGSGKTTLLVAIANALPHTNGLYLAYNNSVAKEATHKFPSTTHCMTTHALAYRATVKQFKLALGTFTYKSIQEPVKYEIKCEIVDYIRSFCLSKYLTFAEFALELDLPTYYVPIATKYLDLMQNGRIECTHDFYLKLFHILLATNQITYDPFDFIMLDEAGDLNEVTLAIFQLLPTSKRIAVGDKHQNIYQFNNTINCFSVLDGQGTTFRLTQSFRVASHIATRIESFCRSYLDPDMQFKGIQLTDTSIHTRAFLTRTNSTLIAKMIQLNREGISYGLVRDPKEIFKLPLMLCNLSYQGFISDPSYKFLQADIDDWYETDHLREIYPTLFGYIASLCSEDDQLTKAISLIGQYGKAKILDAYEEARKHRKSSQSFILATAHSTKGLEFDEVTIADDLNECMKPIVPDPALLSSQQREIVNLYYVACSRAAKQLNNALYL